MIEVFKTNVIDQGHARMLVDQIHKTFSEYRANFDLEDCDKILRVKSATGSIQPSLLIDLLHRSGFDAQILPDDDQAAGQILLNKELLARKVMS